MKNSFIKFCYFTKSEAQKWVSRRSKSEVNLCKKTLNQIQKTYPTLTPQALHDMFMSYIIHIQQFSLGSYQINLRGKSEMQIYKLLRKNFSKRHENFQLQLETLIFIHEFYNS